MTISTPRIEPPFSASRHCESWALLRCTSAAAVVSRAHEERCRLGVIQMLWLATGLGVWHLNFALTSLEQQCTSSVYECRIYRIVVGRLVDCSEIIRSITHGSGPAINLVASAG